MKHTPGHDGRWRYTDGGIIDDNPPAGHAGVEIADVHGADPHDARGPELAEAQANGRLIAASPKLAEACRRIGRLPSAVNTSDFHACIEETPNFIAELKACVIEARAALALLEENSNAKATPDYNPDSP